jgi:hypothetical protein
MLGTININIRFRYWLDGTLVLSDLVIYCNADATVVLITFEYGVKIPGQR